MRREHERDAVHHRGSGGRRAAQPRRHGAADRHAARPAGADGVGVPRPGHAARRASGTSTPARIAAMGEDDFVAVCCERRRSTASRRSMARRIHALCVVLDRRYGGRAEGVWADVATARRAVPTAARAARVRRREGADLHRPARQAHGRAAGRVARGRRQVRRRSPRAASPTRRRRRRWPRCGSGSAPRRPPQLDKQDRPLPAASAASRTV